MKYVSGEAKIVINIYISLPYKYIEAIYMDKSNQSIMNILYLLTFTTQTK